MDDEEDMDIAAAMGFGSFGGTKKRKYDQTNSPKAASKEDASGANTTQLGVRTKKPATEDPDVAHADDATTHIASTSSQRPKNTQKPPAATGLADFLARAQTLPDNPTTMQENRSAQVELRQPTLDEMVSFGGPAISKAELNALKFGVKNEYGDTAYFLPSFVEDPWAKLLKVGQ